MKLLPLAVALLSLTLVSAKPVKPRSGATVDWPAWRGADRTGISHETGLMTSWPEGGPKLLWKCSGLGEGYSTPSVAGKLIYGMGNANGQEWVFALDRTKAGQAGLGHAIGISASRWGRLCRPSLDPHGRWRPGLRAGPQRRPRRARRQERQRDLAARPERRIWGRVGGWGYSESVLVDGPWVVCTPGGDRPRCSL